MWAGKYEVMFKVERRFIGALFGMGIIYLLFLVYPMSLFAYKYEYRNYVTYSDKPILKNIDFVLDDAIARLEKSELYRSQDRFNLYLCNRHWRFKFFTRNENAGGVVNYFLSGNIFLRENDIKLNKLIPPSSWRNPMIDRPLSYFIAHETIHSLQRSYDKYLIFKVPVEIIEGYADYIAKFETSDMAELKEGLMNNSPTMNPKNGLYDRYHLYVGYLMEQKGYSFRKIVKDKPDMEEVLAEIVPNVADIK